MWDWSLHRVPTGALPTGAVGTGLPARDPWMVELWEASILSLEIPQALNSDPREQPWWLYTAKPEAELRKVLGTYPLHKCALDVGHEVNNYFGALRFNVCPTGFQICLRPVTPFFCPTSPFGNGNIYPTPVLHWILEANNLVLIL